MSQRKDYTGQRFGNLVALHPVNRSDPSGRSRMWLFQCDCGALVERPAAIVALVAKKTRKDGAPFSPKCSRTCSLARLPGNEAAFNRVFDNYKRDAKRRGLVFQLTKNNVKELSMAPCAYCGAPPKQVGRPSRNTTPSRQSMFVHNGIDRIDSGVGYVLNNVVPCCKQCNRAKSDLSYEEFAYWIARAYQHLFAQHN